MYMPFDLVTYTGEKFRGDIKDKLGEVVCPVAGDPGKYVVEFGDNSYILGEGSFRRYYPSAKDKEVVKQELQVTHRRRRPTEDET